MIHDDMHYPDMLNDENAYKRLIVAVEPLWDELARLGWVDDFGGGEFQSCFPATLDFIHAFCNTVPVPAATDEESA